MAPICIVTGNCIVLKVASFVPQSAWRISELWKQAGLPDGVLNLVTTAAMKRRFCFGIPTSRELRSLVPTSVGKHIYARPRNGKRVQALTEAKNHALVLKDAVIERAAQGIINSSADAAGERCMALPWLWLRTPC